MPYLIVKRKKKFAVHKQGAGGRPVGKPLGTHMTRAEAEAQMKALYANMHQALGEIRVLDRSLAENLLPQERRLDKGQPLSEQITKGSLEYTSSQIRDAFREQFRAEFTVPGSMMADPPWVNEIFDGYVIASHSDLDSDEYYKVSYTEKDGEYVFAASADWEIVELTYQPATAPASAPAEESAHASGNGRSKRFKEASGRVLLEASEGKTGPRRIRGTNVITADLVNENRRRYPGPVLAAAIGELKTHLHESAGQGRLVQILGEADHPSHKGAPGPRLLETVVKWNDVPFDGKDVSLAGHILETSQGRDLIALMEGGVSPGISLRGYGDSKILTENGASIEEVTELHITGFDLVAEPGFVDSAAVLESKRHPQEESDMDPEKLKQLIEQHPELFKGLFEGQLKDLGAEQMKKLEETVRQKLGIKAEDDLGKALTEAAEAQKKLADQDRHAAIVVEIARYTKDLPYPANIAKVFTESLQGQAYATVEDVKPFAEAQRKTFDAIAAEMKLRTMGYGLTVTGPVLEQETGYKEFARGAYEFTEALQRRGLGKHLDPRKPANRNDAFTAMVLERFDQAYARVQNGGGLIAESKLLQEAEQTSDLSLPYSASRAIIAVATAQLIASSVFDFGVVETSPTRVYYEQYAADTTIDTVVAVGADAVTADYNVWVDLANKRIKPGTVVVKNHAEGVTYVEGTDYVIDYGNGKFMALNGAGATIAEADTHLGYTYMAIRKGEMGVIQRGKGQLAYVTLDCQADRLAQQVSSEAIVFSRSQIGWDAVTRTMAMIIEQIRRKIDKDAFYLALASVLLTASNSGGTWTEATDPLDDLASYIGEAKVLVANRYYVPESVVFSVTRSNDLSNWSGFTAAGKFPSADLKENGYVGRIKGLPVFETTEFSDSYALVTNRELVAHRVFQPMVIKGPFPSYDQATAQLVAADQYYAEEYNGEVSPVPGKGASVKLV